MRIKTKILRPLRSIAATASLCVLAACGGGGGGGGEPAANPQPAPPPAQQLNFTVSLEDIEVRRLSNGDTVAVDVSSVVQNLTFAQ